VRTATLAYESVYFKLYLREQGIHKTRIIGLMPTLRLVAAFYVAELRPRASRVSSPVRLVFRRNNEEQLKGLD